MSEIRRIDLSKVKRPAKKQETRVFTDPLAPGVELALTLESPCYFHEAGEIGRRAQELCEFWRDPDTLLMRLPPVDGVQTILTDQMALCFATLEKLQAQPPLYDFRDFNELGVKLPSAFAAASEWALGLLPNNDGLAGKRGRTLTSASPSSSSPSTPPESIPPARNGATPASGPSMSVSARSRDSSEEKLLADLDASVMNPAGTG